MAKILPIERDGKKLGYLFTCPACGFGHKICTADAHDEGWPIWELTGTPEAPTIRASILVWWDEGENRKPMRCHSYVTDGKIEFLQDCLHELKGQTVELPDL